MQSEVGAMRQVECRDPSQDSLAAGPSTSLRPYAHASLRRLLVRFVFDLHLPVHCFLLLVLPCILHCLAVNAVSMGLQPTEQRRVRGTRFGQEAA